MEVHELKSGVLYSADQVAEALGMSRRSLDRAVQRGQIPKGRKIGRKRYFLGEEILRGVAVHGQDIGGPPVVD